MSNNKVVKNTREKILSLEKSLISVADGINIEGDGKHIITESKI